MREVFGQARESMVESKVREGDGKCPVGHIAYVNDRFLLPKGVKKAHFLCLVAMRADGQGVSTANDHEKRALKERVEKD